MSDSHKATLARAERADIEGGAPLHPMVRAAMNAPGGPDPVMLEKLMDLQERWEATEARKAFTTAMTGLKRDLPRVIHHDQEVDFKSKKTGTRTHYTHTSLARVVTEVVDVLTEHGFSHSWIPQTSGRDVVVTCRLTHTDGHSEETSLSAPLDTTGNKSPAQGVASTITLLQRYSLLSLLGIATADMKEPTGEGHAPDPGAVDPARTMKALGWLKRQGIAKADAEAELGKRAEAWTNADLEDLKAWATAPKPADDDEPVDAEFEEAPKGDDEWGVSGPDEDVS